MNNVYLIESSTLTGIASAIRSKTGKTNAFTPAQMITEINNMEIGGGMVSPFKYQKTNIRSYTGKEQYILDYAFYSCYRLSNVSFPLCTYIGDCAFSYCSSYALTTADFPLCSYIGSGAFYYCESLTTVSFPECTYIGSNAFQDCAKLSIASFPKCSYIGFRAFSGCRSLTTASFPECTFISDYAFADCERLATTSFPKCSYIGWSAFYYCNTYLRTLSFPQCTYIGYYAFYYCRNLFSLYLNQVTSVPTLESTNAFEQTPLSAGGSGTIYVPSSLYDSFLTADTWSYLSARFVSM